MKNRLPALQLPCSQDSEPSCAILNPESIIMLPNFGLSCNRLLDYYKPKQVSGNLWTTPEMNVEQQILPIDASLRLDCILYLFVLF
jgi:hypothetical protein